MLLSANIHGDETHQYYRKECYLAEVISSVISDTDSFVCVTGGEWAERSKSEMSGHDRHEEKRHQALAGAVGVGLGMFGDRSEHVLG
jgi:hypothetical protein